MTDTQIMTKKDDGTGAFGLYTGFVVYNPSNGALVREERYFLAGEVLCKYVRQKGNKRAAWRAFKQTSHDDARMLLNKNLKRFQTAGASLSLEMVHIPLVIELTSADIDSLAKSEPPYARFDGTRLTEKAVGKINDDTWAPKSAGSPF